MRRPGPELGWCGTDRNPHIVSKQTVFRQVFEIAIYRIKSEALPVNVTINFTLKQATKAQRENRGTALLFL
jgi:hypothetical protein